MRVLITPEWYPWPDQPVYAVFCREQARAVARLEDVVVLTWRLDPALRVPFRIDAASEDGLRTFRIRYARVPVPKTTSLLKVAGCLVALGRLRRRGWNPDVVHAHEYTAAPVALALGLLAGAPVIFTEHYSGFGRMPERERRRARWAFERARVVCPVSDELAGHVRAVAPEATLETVPNVVDTDVFAPPPSPRVSSAPRLVTVGSLIERKGHRHLIAALAQLRERDCPVTLDLIGDGPLRAELEGLAARSGMADAIRFLGASPKDAVADAMRNADAFVLASQWENLPCVLLEAMSTGLPVVATRVGGVPEIVGPDEGILVEPDSPQALADGIQELLRNLAHYDRNRLRDRAVSEYGYDAIARRWAGLYGGLVSERRP